MNENFRYDNTYKAFRKSNKKTLIQFAILFVTSLFIGLFLQCFLSESFLKVQFQEIVLHFEIPIYHGFDNVTACLNAIFKYAFIDILCIFTIFIFSFSSCHYIISGIVLIYSGIRNGCIASLIYLVPKVMSDNHPKIAEIGIFFIAKAIIVLLIIRYIMRALLFSTEFLHGSTESFSMFSETLKFVCASLLYIFTLLLLHGIYIFLIRAI